MTLIPVPTMTIPSHPTLGEFTAQTDVGLTHIAGNCEFNARDQYYTMGGAGFNIWGERDAFHFIWKKISGNFIVTARAALIGIGVNAHRKLGWMARTSLDTASPHACTGIHGDGLVSLQFRRSLGAATGEVRAPLTGADVIQLERAGNTFIMSVAQFGRPFTTVQVDGLDLGDELYVGLFVTSHEDHVLEHASFSNVRFVVPVGPGFNRDRDPFGSRLELLDVTTGHRQIIHTSDKVFEAPNWTPDDQALIYNADGRLIRFDLASNKTTTIYTGAVVHNNNDHVLSFDGSMLAISSRGEESHPSRIYTVPVGGGEPRLITPKGPSYLHGWSPDGASLVYCAARNGEYDIYRIPSHGGDEVQLTTARGLNDGPEYTPDGKYIYFNSVRSGLMQIWRMHPDGSAQQQLTDDEYNNWFPHVSPDGKSIAFVSYLVGEVTPSDHPAAKRVYIRIMPRDGGVPRVVAYVYGGQGTMNVPSWSPDSARLAFVSNSVPLA